MTVSTYSFSDTKMVINFPGFPAFSINGQGVGEITIAYINENSTHDLAADGSVMVSKIKADNADITLTVQQTSTLHQWLKGIFNALMAAPPALWAAGRIDITTAIGGFDQINCTGVSFGKRADQPFQQQGQSVSWAMKAANVNSPGSLLAGVNTFVTGNIV